MLLLEVHEVLHMLLPEVHECLGASRESINSRLKGLESLTADLDIILTFLGTWTKPQIFSLNCVISSSSANLKS